MIICCLLVILFLKANVSVSAGKLKKGNDLMVGVRVAFKS